VLPAWGLAPPVVVAGVGNGGNAGFRDELTAHGCASPGAAAGHQSLSGLAEHVTGAALPVDGATRSSPGTTWRSR
jgi:hypothetical protein